ncbi:DUF4225 domain-containing protein [Pantoea agglomerans]|uniref:DUF4225 domain-containing protein n=1 Tax=Enterobacter agglomerans TaxID=549 RepID=UPI0013C84E7D|nr:DUF4225 domain-containing protein [Pantoea agglomerans]NEG61720.1 DUF4225 domain-containing protein [Pantoea agglomerans]
MDNYLDKKRFNSYYLLQANDATHYLRMTARRLSSQHLRNLISHINFNNEVDRFIEAQLQGIKRAKDEHECKLCLYNLQVEKKLLHQQDAALRMGTAKIVVSADLANNHLDKWGYFVNGVGVLTGTGQIITGLSIAGVSLFSGNAIGIFAGATIFLHGLNNAYESFRNIRYDRNDTEGFLRGGYVVTAEFLGFSPVTGRIAYSLADLSLSGYGLARMVLKPDSWRLYRYLPSDFIRNLKTVGAPSLALEAPGDSFTLKSIYDQPHESN